MVNVIIMSFNQNAIAKRQLSSNLCFLNSLYLKLGYYLTLRQKE
jgi:hypothetical protein